MATDTVEGTGEGRDARERIARLPSPLAAVLRPELPAISDEIVDAIRDEVSAYRRPLGGALGRAVRQGVALSLGQFVELIEDPARTERGATAIRELGRGEMRAGRTLDALQAAYRCGARVSWRRFGDLARLDGADGDVLIGLGEAIFAYVDRLAGLSVAGYAEEQSLRAGATQLGRDALVRAALADPPLPAADVAAAAAALGWPTPRSVAVLVLPRADDPADVLRVDPSVVAATRDGAVVGLAAAATAGIERLGRAFADADAALGPTVPWGEAGTSYRRARAVLRLRDEGRLAGGGAGLLRADEHLAALVVHADGGAADDLAGRALGPLDAVPAGRRERHLETLRAWLDHRGQGPRMAEVLHLHPQTVRYRVARLRETLGVDLDDPDARFALELALRRTGAREGAAPVAGEGARGEGDGGSGAAGSPAALGGTGGAP